MDLSGQLWEGPAGVLGNCGEQPAQLRAKCCHQLTADHLRLVAEASNHTLPVIALPEEQL